MDGNHRLERLGIRKAGFVSEIAVNVCRTGGIGSSSRRPTWRTKMPSHRPTTTWLRRGEEVFCRPSSAIQWIGTAALSRK